MLVGTAWPLYTRIGVSTAITSSPSKDFLKETSFSILTVEWDSLKMSSILECQLLLFAFISAGIANNLSEWKKRRD